MLKYTFDSGSNQFVQNMLIDPASSIVFQSTGSVSVSASFASASVSQTLFSVNPNRKALAIQNVGAYPISYAMGVSASVSGSFTLAPGSSYISHASAVSTNTINVVSAFTGSLIAAIEYS